jgi:hypothetical protein
MSTRRGQDEAPRNSRPALDSLETIDLSESGPELTNPPAVATGAVGMMCEKNHKLVLDKVADPKAAA